MAKMTGSWLSGSNSALPNDDDTEQAYQGEKLGLPKFGEGALAPTARRAAALFIDWITSMGVAALILAGNIGGSISTVTLAVWFVIGVLSVTFFSFTPGQLFMGIRVSRVDAPGRVGFARALVRSLILMFVVPAVVTDADSRGMHDRATGTALVYAR